MLISMEMKWLCIASVSSPTQAFDASVARFLLCCHASSQIITSFAVQYHDHIDHGSYSMKSRYKSKQ